MANPFLIKVAVGAGTSKGGQKVIGGIGLLFLLLCGAVASLISIFSNSGKIDSNFKAQETVIYKELRAVYDEYTLELREKMEKYVEDCKKAHSYSYIKPDGEAIMVPWADVSYEMNYINSSYTMAYLSIKNRDDYLSDKNKIKINKEEVITFWNAISGVVVEEGVREDGTPTYLYYNPVMTAEEIAEKFFISESMQEQYLESVYLISQYIGLETFADSVHAAPNQLGIPLYYQYAQPWGSKAYGNATISKNGCAPTCIAMVLTYLKGYTITPADVVDFTGNNYYINGQGSTWTIFGACANAWGVNCVQIGVTQKSIIQALEQAKPVILSMGPGTFTKSGHVIVLTGITENGRITVNDPNDNSNKDFANKEFSISQILNEAKGGWIFE